MNQNNDNGSKSESQSDNDGDDNELRQALNNPDRLAYRQAFWQDLFQRFDHREDEEAIANAIPMNRIGR